MINFETESEEVRYQILAFGLRLMARIDTYEDNDVRERGKAIISFGWKKLKYDSNYYIRERARMMIFMNENKLFDKNQDFMQTYEKQLSLTEKERLNKLKEENDMKLKSKQLSLSVYAKVINAFFNIIMLD